MRILGRDASVPVCLLAICAIQAAPAGAATFAVTVYTDSNSGGRAGTGVGVAGDLRSAILAANASPGADTIGFVCGAPPCTITLSGPLPPITDSLTIDGGTMGNIVVSGANLYRVFFVDVGVVAIRNLVIRDGSARGGAGGGGDGGGGGGAGLGGGLFVNQAGAAVTLANVRFVNCSSVGGAGGVFFSHAWAGGGGGGFVFRGGVSTANSGGPGGGGVLAAGGDASNTDAGNGGAGGGGGGGQHGGAAGFGSTGYAGNSGGAAATGSAGGAGGFGGGGGGAALGVGGAGGFGGGGGGTGATGAAGAGGVGGGGGGADGGARGVGGSLGGSYRGGDGGTGAGAGGGGGAAVGPAVFLNAGSLTLSNAYAGESTATAGAGGTGDFGHNGTAGSADATSLFNYAGIVNGDSTTGPRPLLDLLPAVPTVSNTAAVCLAVGFAWLAYLRIGRRRNPTAERAL